MLAWLSIFKLKIKSRSLYLIRFNEVFGNGFLHCYGNVFMSQLWVRFMLIMHLQSILGIYTDCSKFFRRAFCIWVLLPQVSGISMDLYLLTFQFPVGGKSEVKSTYTRLYFWRGGDINNFEDTSVAARDVNRAPPEA